MRKPVVWLKPNPARRNPTAGLLPRPRLVDLLSCDAPFSSRLKLVLAPAGFGKTVLLRQVVSALEAAGAQQTWLDCAREDRGAEHLLSRLGAGLEAIGLVPARTAPSVSAISQALAGGASPGAIIVDEYEHACSDENDIMLLELARALPPCFMLVVASRRRPNIPLARGMVSGDLQVIDGRALRFAADEVPALFSERSEDEGIKALIEAAAGWPAILTLLRLAAGGHSVSDPPHQIIEAVREHIRDYISGEILAPSDPPLRDFLLDTAVLEEIDAEAADSIRSSRDSHELIQQLESLVPLVSFGTGPRRATLHPLLRDVLRTELQRTDPQRLTRQHLAAAEYHARSARVYEAVTHALNAKDVARAVRVIERSGPLGLQVSEGPRGVRHLLDLLPQGVVANNVRLSLTRVVQLAMEENIVEAKLEYQRLDHEMQALPEIPEIVRLEFEIVSCVTKVYESEHSLVAEVWPAIARAAEQARRWALDDPRLLVIPCAIELLFLLRTGQIDLAEGRLNEVDQLFRRLRISSKADWLWAYRGVIHLGRLEFDAAEVLLLRALRAAEESFGPDRSPLADYGHACLARLYFTRNLTDKALEHIAALGEAPSWNVIEVLDAFWVLKARCCIAQGRCDEAFRILREGRAAAMARSLVHLTLICGATEVELLSRLGRLTEAHELAAAIDLQATWELAMSSRTLPWVDVKAAAEGLFALAMARQDFASAGAIADQCMAQVAGSGNVLGEINAAMLKTRSSQLLGRTAVAQATLGEAIARMRGLDGLRLLLDAGPELVPALRAIVDERDGPVAQGASAIMAALEGDVRLWMSSDPLFTAREHDVFAGLLRAASTKEIARQLELSPETVKTHLKAIFGKLRVRDRNEAVTEAWRRVLDRQTTIEPGRK
jgi:LuxR family maltose regulon positive regulatory protein